MVSQITLRVYARGISPYCIYFSCIVSLGLCKIQAALCADEMHPDAACFIFAMKL